MCLAAIIIIIIITSIVRGPGPGPGTFRLCVSSEPYLSWFPDYAPLFLTQEVGSAVQPISWNICQPTPAWSTRNSLRRALLIVYPGLGCVLRTLKALSHTILRTIERFFYYLWCIRRYYVSHPRSENCQVAVPGFKPSSV